MHRRVSFDAKAGPGPGPGLGAIHPLTTTPQGGIGAEGGPHPVDCPLGDGHTHVPPSTQAKRHGRGEHWEVTFEYIRMVEKVNDSTITPKIPSTHQPHTLCTYVAHLIHLLTFSIPLYNRKWS